jgi:hypothetical protein
MPIIIKKRQDQPSKQEKLKLKDVLICLHHTTWTITEQLRANNNQIVVESAGFM